MSQVVFLDPDTRCWFRQIDKNQTRGSADIWPEVSSRYSQENPAPFNPENSQRRVLLEVGLVLAVAATMALAAALWAPLLL